MHEFLFDECISWKVPDLLTLASCPAKCKSTKAAGFRGMPDELWMPICAQRGWVVLSLDRNERTRIYGRDQVIESGGRHYYLVASYDDLGIWAKSVWWVENIERIISHVDEHPEPNAWLVRLHGKILPY